MSKKPLIDMRSVGISLTALLGIGLFSSPVQATEQRQGRTMSLWGGYFSTDGPEIEGFSDGTSANLPIRNVTRSDPDQGWLGGVSFGFDVEPNALMFNRIDWYFEGQMSERDSNTLTSVGVGSIPFVSGLSAGIGPVPLTAFAERERYEFGAQLSDFGHVGTWENLQISLFGGFGSEHAVSTAVLSGFNLTVNDSDLDWWFVGALAGSEHVLPINEDLNLAFDANVGPYFYDANGKVSGTHSLGAASATTSDSGFGIRANAQVELRKMLSPSLKLALFTGVDYWSDIPFSQLNDPSNWNSHLPPAIGSDSLFDIRAGIKLTVKLGDG